MMDYNNASDKITDNQELLNDWEVVFISSVYFLIKEESKLSDKQDDVFKRIYRKVKSGGV